MEGLYPDRDAEEFTGGQIMNRERLKVKSKKLRVLISEEGIALIMVIILSAIALAIMAALLYMVMSRTEMAGLQKRYRTSLEAGMGGASLVYKFIDFRGDTGDNQSFTNTLTSSGINYVTGSAFIATRATCSTAPACVGMGSYQGLATKLNLPTNCWQNCDYNQPISTTYDMAFNLPGTATGYNVYAKIVDTVLGNSAAGEDLSVQGVTEQRQAQRQSVPFLYSIEVEAEAANNPSAERAKLSILYQY